MRQIEVFADSIEKARMQLCPVVNYVLLDTYFCTERKSKVFVFKIKMKW